MKVPHHGSADPGLPALLERLRPEVAAIEVGRGNTYGHPRRRRSTRSARASAVYRTDRDGTVDAHGRGRRHAVESSAPAPHPVDSARGRPQARLPRLRRRRRQDRRLARPRAPRAPRRSADRAASRSSTPARRCRPRPSRRLAALTFATGTRYVLVDEVEAWKAAELDPLERGPRRHAARHRAGADRARQGASSSSARRSRRPGARCASTRRRSRGELPKWVARARARARPADRQGGGQGAGRAGRHAPAAARARGREARGLRVHPSTSVTPRGRRGHGRRRHPPAGLRPRRRGGGRRPARGARVRGAARVARASGRRGCVYRSSAACARCTGPPRCSTPACPRAKVGEALRRRPGWPRRSSARAKKADRAALERAICVFADLEVDLRGGGDVQLDEDTAFSLALARAAG